MWSIIVQNGQIPDFYHNFILHGTIKSKILSNNTFALSPYCPAHSNPSTMIIANCERWKLSTPEYHLFGLPNSTCWGKNYLLEDNTKVNCHFKIDNFFNLKMWLLFEVIKNCVIDTSLHQIQVNGHLNIALLKRYAYHLRAVSC